ncbi:MAG: GGDEF domain-containing protein, partial [Nanoarchaeota archaeon]
EEFAMILPKTTNENAFKAAERIRKDIETAEILFQGNIFRISGSFGVASYPESEAMSSFELVDRADKALYQAKRNGKNRVETFSISSQKSF